MLTIQRPRAISSSRLVIKSPRHDLTDADLLNDASGDVGVRFKRRKRGGERIDAKKILDSVAQAWVKPVQ